MCYARAVIGRLSGVVVEQGADGSVIFDVRGVGYEVFVPAGTVPRLGPAEVNGAPPASGGGRAREHVLHIHMHAREDALLVSFGSGGRTPGDAYLWTVGADGRPTAWRMWVSILPIGGLKVSWAGWTRLSTGAWVATEHALGPIDLCLTQVEGAASLAALLGDQPDPFAPLEQASP